MNSEIDQLNLSDSERDLLEQIIVQAKQRYLEIGEVYPTIVVGNSETLEWHMEDIPLVTGDSMEAQLEAKLNAILLARNAAWSIEANIALTVFVGVESDSGAISPRECLMILLERVAGYAQLYYPLSGAGEQRAVGQARLEMTDHLEGRFSAILPCHRPPIETLGSSHSPEGRALYLRVNDPKLMSQAEEMMLNDNSNRVLH